MSNFTSKLCLFGQAQIRFKIAESVHFTVRQMSFGIYERFQYLKNCFLGFSMEKKPHRPCEFSHIDILISSRKHMERPWEGSDPSRYLHKSQQFGASPFGAAMLRSCPGRQVDPRFLGQKKSGAWFMMT
jgi:hypothetical protein